MKSKKSFQQQIGPIVARKRFDCRFCDTGFGVLMFWPKRKSIVMMAAFLTQLGALPNEKLKAEQLRELFDLQRLVPALSRDHLSITMDFCQLQFNGYGDRDAALRPALQRCGAGARMACAGHVRAELFHRPPDQALRCAADHGGGRVA